MSDNGTRGPDAASDPERADGEDTTVRDAEEVTAWQAVPESSPGVRVRWSDLKAMRRRIDELRRERDRLQRRLERSRTRRRETVARYERLLDRDGEWQSAVPGREEVTTAGGETRDRAAGDEPRTDDGRAPSARTALQADGGRTATGPGTARTDGERATVDEQRATTEEDSGGNGERTTDGSGGDEGAATGGGRLGRVLAAVAAAFSRG